MTHSNFLPVSLDDMRARDWYYYDFLLITGDAYVDHPSFGASVIGRVLEADGFRVAVLANRNGKARKNSLQWGVRVMQRSSVRGTLIQWLPTIRLLKNHAVTMPIRRGGKPDAGRTGHRLFMPTAYGKHFRDCRSY